MNVALRPAEASDEAFLYRLFVSSRGDILALVPEPRRTELLRMQFRGQSQTYNQRYPASTHNIVLFDGVEAGRVWVAETAEALAVVDIALLPEYRNRGIGRKIYSGLIAKAEAAGKDLHATVSTDNPDSLRFHERLGFRRIPGEGLYISLTRPSTVF